MRIGEVARRTVLPFIRMNSARSVPEGRGTAAARPIRPLPGHELPMPTKGRVRRHEGRDLRQHPAAKSVSRHSEASAGRWIESGRVDFADDPPAMVFRVRMTS